VRAFHANATVAGLAPCSHGFCDSGGMIAASFRVGSQAELQPRDETLRSLRSFISF
jgi:hypothetical protein